jgi:hypothetical protein
MKVLYILLIILIVIMFILYFINGSYNNDYFKPLLKKSDKFKFVSGNNDELNLSDDFGDIIKVPYNYNNKSNTEYNIKVDNESNDELDNEYIEGFERNIYKRENFNQEHKVKLLPQVYTPRYVWTYWENKSGRSKPYAHIQLCFETMLKHYNKYNFIILNPETIKQYLPNIRTDLNNLMIAQKVDYYRVALLETYGGIWVDADTIALRDLDEVFDKLDNGYDFVGFGCTGKICFDGYPDPSNGVMGSRKNGRLMKCCLTKLDSMLNADNKNHKYFDLGKNVIWDCIYELKPYDYYHFPSEYDGSRDINGKWVHTSKHLSETDTKLINEDKAFFIFLANYEIMNKKKYEWFLDLNETEILNGKWWISRLYNKALK